MSKKPLNISEEAAVQMPMKTVASLILLVAAGVFAYTELTARLVSLETSRELMKADLLKASDQKPVDQEQFMLLESLFSDVEKLMENHTNKIDEILELYFTILNPRIFIDMCSIDLGKFFKINKLNSNLDYFKIPSVSNIMKNQSLKREAWVKLKLLKAKLNEF